ncbi:MAG: type II secretion system protein J [Acidobacteriota bacterium]
MKNKGVRNAGHTLVETMIASSISIIVLAGFFSTIGVFQTGSSNLSLLLERDANLWLAPLLLSRWIIPAGNNRWDQAWSGITMGTDHIELKSDIDGPGGFPDSKLTSSFETLALRSSSSNLRVLSNRGSFQPLIKNIVDFKVESKENGLLSIRLIAITDRPLSMIQESLLESVELLFFLRNYRSNLFPENP